MPGRPKLLDKLRTFKQFKDVNSDQQVHGLEQNVVIDRDTAARLGVTPAQIDSVLYDAFGQRQISTIYQTLNQYHVVLEVDPRYQMTPDASAERVRDRQWRVRAAGCLCAFRPGQYFSHREPPGAVPVR